MTIKNTGIYLSGFDTRCLYSVSRQPSPRSKNSPSPPMIHMISQSLPPSSASSVMIMSHSFDLAGLAHRKNYLTHCTAFLLETLIKVTKSPLLTPLRLTQKKARKPPTVFTGLGLGSLLTASKLRRQTPLGFFPATLAWTMPVFKWKLSGYLLVKSHRCIFNY